MENSMVLLKIKNRTVTWTSNFTSGYLSKEDENTNLKRYMHSSVHCSIIYLQQPKYEDNLSVHQQVNGEETLCEYSIHTMEYYLAKEQNEILPSTT